MKLPTLTPAEYKKEWANLIEENARLRKKLERAEKDVEEENYRFGQAVSLRLAYLEDRKLTDDYNKWFEQKRAEYKRLLK